MFPNHHHHPHNNYNQHHPHNNYNQHQDNNYHPHNNYNQHQDNNHHPHNNYNQHQDNDHHPHNNQHQHQNSSFGNMGNMKNHRCEEYHETFLSMKISCCETCPERLLKKLHRLYGVDKAIIVEKDLIRVSGTIEPETLLKYVSTLGKKVKVVGKEEVKKRKREREKEEQKERERVYKEKAKAVEEAPHICEAWTAYKVDEKYCRYLYCKDHPRSLRGINPRLEDACLSLAGFGPFEDGPFRNFNGHQLPYYGPPVHQQPYQQNGRPFQQLNF